MRLTVIRSSPFDDVSRKPQFAPGYDDALRRLGCLIEALGRREKATVVDFRTPVNDGIAAVLRGDPELARMLLPDRVHPGTAGHLLMGATLLRAWNAPPLVARVEIDVAAGRVASAENTTVTELTAAAGGLAWTQLDRALPLPVAFEDVEVQLAEKAGADLASLDSELLVVRGLASGRYELRIDGQSVGTFSAADLASGVNLALYNTPQRWQAFTARWSIEDSFALQPLRRRLTAGGADDARVKATVAFLDAKDDAARRDRREACRPKPRQYQLAAVAATAGSRHN